MDTYIGEWDAQPAMDLPDQKHSAGDRKQVISGGFTIRLGYYESSVYRSVQDGL